MDGSLADFFTQSNSDALVVGGDAYVLDYAFDDALSAGRLDFLKLRDLDGVRALMAAGEAYARREMEAGALDRVFAGVRRQGGPLAAPAAAGL